MQTSQLTAIAPRIESTIRPIVPAAASRPATQATRIERLMGLPRSARLVAASGRRADALDDVVVQRLELERGVRDAETLREPGRRLAQYALGGDRVVEDQVR